MMEYLLTVLAVLVLGLFFVIVKLAIRLAQLVAVSDAPSLVVARVLSCHSHVATHESRGPLQPNLVVVPPKSLWS